MAGLISIMKRLAKTIIFVFIALIISTPLIYADGCECDISVVICHHPKPQDSMQKMATCHLIASEDTNKCSCPQEVSCEFTKNKPSVLLTMRAVPFNQTTIKIQWAVSAGQDDLGLSNQMEIADFFYFSEKSSLFDKIYLTNQAFLC